MAQIRWPTDMQTTDLTAFREDGRGPLASGPVRAKLAADGIAHIVLLQAKSNATPDVVVKLLRRAIAESTDFIEPPPTARSAPRAYWLDALVITQDQRYLRVQLGSDADLARVVGEDFQGYFVYR